MKKDKQETLEKPKEEKKEESQPDEYEGLNESQIAHLERMKKAEA